MSDRADQRHRERIRQFVDRRQHPDPCKAERAQRALDFWLDQYADCLLRATEWDATEWGFDPDRWMEKERAELGKRGGRDYPAEAI